MSFPFFGGNSKKIYLSPYRKRESVAGWQGIHMAKHVNIGILKNTARLNKYLKKDDYADKVWL